MREQTYEEYISSILGYPLNSNNSTCQKNNFENQISMSYTQNIEYSRLEEYYPEMYKIIYPMVIQACNKNIDPITKELIQTMTDDIYTSIENDTEINVNIKQKDMSKQRENRREDRQSRNSSLRDLIQILIIRELQGMPGFPGSRPPIRTQPPFPIGPRPPIRPRGEYEYPYDFYEK
jgi:hypothetical protein